MAFGVDDRFGPGVDLVPEAVVVIGHDGALRGGNDRATALLGVSGADVGRPAAEAIDLRDASGTRCATIAPAEQVDRMAERLLRVHLRDGRSRAVALSGRRHDDAWVVTARSAGRRERVDANRADVVATVSHEIRSPLTSVKGFTRTLLKRWDRFDDDQKRHMLETINEDADRVTRLLTELLDVSRIDAGRVQLHRRMADVGALVRKVVDGAMARHEDRTIHLDVGDEVQAYVDPDKVTQVVTNLVENALRYAEGSPVWVAATRDGDEVHVRVRDEGDGIELDQQRRVFEKFGRGRESRRAGTGLGLFISRGLVRAHGGDVTLESEPGHGATFHVRLPASSPFDDDIAAAAERARAAAQHP